MTGFGRRVTGEVLSRAAGRQMQQKTPGRGGGSGQERGLSPQEPQSDSPKGLGGLRSLFLGASSTSASPRRPCVLFVWLLFFPFKLPWGEDGKLT